MDVDGPVPPRARSPSWAAPARTGPHRPHTGSALPLSPRSRHTHSHQALLTRELIINRAGWGTRRWEARPRGGTWGRFMRLSPWHRRAGCKHSARAAAARAHGGVAEVAVESPRAQPAGPTARRPAPCGAPPPPAGTGASPRPRGGGTAHDRQPRGRGTPPRPGPRLSRPPGRWPAKPTPSWSATLSPLHRPVPQCRTDLLCWPVHPADPHGLPAPTPGPHPRLPPSPQRNRAVTPSPNGSEPRPRPANTQT